MELRHLLPTLLLITISPTLLPTLLHSLAIRMPILHKLEVTPLHKGEATRLHPRTFPVLQGTEDPPQNLRSRGARGEDCFQGKDCLERQ